MVAPFDQILPIWDDDVKITFPPEQKVVEPDAEIVGVVGVLFTVTIVEADIAEQVPFDKDTE